MISVKSPDTEEFAMLDAAKAPSIAEDLPTASYDLIEFLVEMYPHRCIRPGESVDEAHHYSGKVQLVSELADWMRRELGV